MDKPLGITDLYATTTEHWPDHWYWCRQHERAESADEPPVIEDPAHPAAAAIDPGCIRVGPFMSENEANRLNGHALYRNIGGYMSLGMEVEP